MAAVPKRKHSKGRRDRRRSHLALVAKSVSKCSNCGALRRPHTACETCGFYRGAQVLAVS